MDESAYRVVGKHHFRIEHGDLVRYEPGDVVEDVTSGDLAAFGDRLQAIPPAERAAARRDSAARVQARQAAALHDQNTAVAEIRAAHAALSTARQAAARGVISTEGHGG